MNDQSPAPEPHDRLARAEAALRGTPVPEGPSDELVARTRAALLGADRRADPFAFSVQRRRRMIAMFKLTAAASLVAGLSYLALAPKVEATTMFEEAARKIQAARTLSYRGTVQIPGQKEPTIIREFYKDPGLVRSETETPYATVSVMDMASGKILTLDPKTKLAFVQNSKLPEAMKGKSLDRAADAMKHLRSLAGKEGKPVGMRMVGEVEAKGFRVIDGEQSWTVWVDPGRKFPLLAETTYRLGDRDIAASMGDFRIDPPLDDALFRLTPPEGYTLRKLDGVILLREEALIDLLRLYADASGGTFPAKADDTAIYQKQFPKEKWTGPDDPKMLRFARSMAAAVVFLQFELKNAYGYKPDGVKLGDADKVLLWYRPKDAKQYRAIFGDLHAEDVPADRLPERPKF